MKALTQTLVCLCKRDTNSMKPRTMLRLCKRVLVFFLARAVCFMPLVTVDSWWQELCVVSLLLGWLWYDAAQSEMCAENIRQNDSSVTRHHKVATAVMDLACNYGV